MVVPIDFRTPKGRLIKPQAQSVREILDQNAIVLAIKEIELSTALEKLETSPDLVVTDSQAIMRVMNEVPQNVRLTTFSI